MANMASRTQVYDFHRKNGNLVEYAGYDLPVWYTGIIDECKTVREHTGIFDVSHMGRVLVDGKDSTRFLDHVTTNNVSSLTVNQGHYSLLCNRGGGIIDDLTVFRLDQSKFLVVYNAANRGKNWTWLLKNRGQYRVDLSDVSNEVAMFAVQGPGAAGVLQSISGLELEEIERYSSLETRADGIPCLITRTGYTGEDGFEIYVWNASVDKPENAVQIWNSILAKSTVHPIGLGARDVLRLEAGMCLYGNDIDEKTSPVQAKLMFVTRLEKPDFNGRERIASEKLNGPERVRVGFKIIGKGIPRKGQEIFSTDNRSVGIVTSGTLSPTLGESIGMGYVIPEHSRVGERFEVRVRDRNLPAVVVKLPFYQRRSRDKVIVYGHEMGLREYRESRARPLGIHKEEAATRIFS